MKKIHILWSVLFILTLLFGVSLGKLDFFGFLDGRHAVNFRYLISALFCSYFLTLTTIFIDLAEHKKERSIYAVATILFTIIFTIINGNVLASAVAGLIFIIFLMIISFQAKKRIEIFVALMPSELFAPILKKGFLFVVGMFAVVNFFQSQARLETNTLVNANLIKTITKPFIIVFNKQLENQLRNQLKGQFGATENTAARRQIVEFVLKETIESTLGSRALDIHINADKIPVEKAVMYQNGTIDISPVITDISDDIAQSLNEKLKPFTLIAPFIVALVIILIFQPLFWPIELFEGYMSRFIFFVLLKSGFIKIHKETREVERIKI